MMELLASTTVAACNVLTFCRYARLAVAVVFQVLLLYLLQIIVMNKKQ